MRRASRQAQAQTTTPTIILVATCQTVYVTRFLVKQDFSHTPTGIFTALSHTYIAISQPSVIN